MVFERTLRSLSDSLGLVLCGLTSAIAFQRGFWGLLTGSVLIAVGLSVSNWRRAMAGHRERVQASSGGFEIDTGRLLLDAVPTPMVAIERGTVRVLNRAARHLFSTDDRVIPPPSGLVDADANHIALEGRSWRVARTTLDRRGEDYLVAALVDVELEERTAEARAASEMIHVLGHELLNGLAPMTSLAESGESVLDRSEVDLGLLREILGTIARRAESLQRFTEAYRSLARLPEPSLGPVASEPLLDDLSRLFVGRWPSISLVIDTGSGMRKGLTLLADRDQLMQALWALLQNAAEATTSVEGQEGQVSLAVRAGAHAVTIDVEDNGAGVLPEIASRIFRPFQTTKAGGTGIGLSLARQIAQSHGGSLSLLPGPVTTFRLSIPSAPTLDDHSRRTDC